MLNVLAGHSSFQGLMCVAFLCLLFVCFIRDSGISMERTVCSVSVSPLVWFPVQNICASEVNPEEGLSGHFIGVFSRVGFTLCKVRLYYGKKSKHCSLPT